MSSPFPGAAQPPPRFHNPLDEVRRLSEQISASQKKEAQLLTQQNVKALGERVDLLETLVDELASQIKELRGKK